ncbi:MAG: hypothetical protein KJ939_00885 [Nanoarchaeota archaeon]|nr:hypothetical protein [Nanoarchaeota archaeon]
MVKKVKIKRESREILPKFLFIITAVLLALAGINSAKYLYGIDGLKTLIIFAALLSFITLTLMFFISTEFIMYPQSFFRLPVLKKFAHLLWNAVEKPIVTISEKLVNAADVFMITIYGLGSLFFALITILFLMIPAAILFVIFGDVEPSNLVIFQYVFFGLYLSIRFLSTGNFVGKTNQEAVRKFISDFLFFIFTVLLIFFALIGFTSPKIFSELSILFNGKMFLKAFFLAILAINAEMIIALKEYLQRKKVFPLNELKTRQKIKKMFKK